MTFIIILNCLFDRIIIWVEVIVNIIYTNFLSMAKVKGFDQKAANNRARVERCRDFKKMKSMHETYIRNRVYPNEGVPMYGMLDLVLDQADIEFDIESEISEKLRYWSVNHTQ